jgi:hypothetical protein
MCAGSVRRKKGLMIEGIQAQMLLVLQALFGSKEYAGVDCPVDDIVEDWKACACFYENCLWV